MLNPEDFQTPLEKQLKLRIILDEIENCTDREKLRENLKQCAEQLMKYQHLLSVVLEKQLMMELSKWEGEAIKIVKEMNG